ncbi:MAG: TnpV protein [Ruminiclostridium sp.]|nr:TnpV protein [Ruminiclostridium sp.]
MTEERMTKTIEGVEVTYRLDKKTQTWIPVLDDLQEVEIGKYGTQRLKYLKENRRVLLNTMTLNGTLESHLKEIDEACYNQVELFIQKNAESFGATEELQMSNPMEWAAKMNTLQKMAEETIQELIYG